MRPILLLLLLATACPSSSPDDPTGPPGDDDSGDDDSAGPPGDDDSADDDDSGHGGHPGDDDSADDDDSAALLPCAWALSRACADEVVDAPDAGVGDFSDPERAVNGVRGAGWTSGGFDVYSLKTDRRQTLTLRWSERIVVDGPGLDLVVFENPFAFGSQGSVFMDPAVVEVSLDGQGWVAFPHAYLGEDPTVHTPDPALWPGFAGITPVLLHEEDNPVDPVDPSVAGGDGFDLADLPDDGAVGSAVREGGARFVRITTASLVLDPETGLPYPPHPTADGADIDGIYAATLRPDPEGGSKPAS